MRDPPRSLPPGPGENPRTGASEGLRGPRNGSGERERSSGPGKSICSVHGGSSFPGCRGGQGTRPERVSPCILPEYKGIQASLFEPDKSDHPRLRAEVRLMEGNWLVPKKKKITNHDLFPYPVQGHNNSLGRRASLAVGNVFHPGSHFYAHFYDQSNTV